MRARIATDDFICVGGRHRHYAFLVRIEQRDRVGKIKLAMHIIRTQRGKARPQLLEREAINTRIDFVDRALLGRKRTLFNHRRDATVALLADHAPVARRISKIRGQKRRSSIFFAMRLDQRSER